MFDDYALEVLQDYQRKKTGGTLLNNLSHPTPAKLKKECLLVFDRRFLKKDEMTLSSFFNQREDEAAYRLAIKKWETDKFRRLNIVMRDGAGKTDEKNIELLAWLTDFQPRPYSVWLKNKPKLAPIEQPQEVTEGLQTTDFVKPEESTPLLTGAERLVSLFSQNSKRGISIGVLLLFCVAAGSFLFNRRPAGDEKCMYWDNDHYESIDCGEKPVDRSIVVLALDKNKQRQFKRITRADTLTAASIGKAWYVKVNGGLEYYTAAGEHPLYPEKRLLPLTVHILDKYPRLAD